MPNEWPIGKAEVDALVRYALTRKPGLMPGKPQTH